MKLSIQQDNPCLNNDGRAYFPMLDDETKYIQCSFGRMFVRDCPPGLVWNNDMMFCGHTNPSLKARLIQRKKAVNLKLDNAPINAESTFMPIMPVSSTTPLPLQPIVTATELKMKTPIAMKPILAAIPSQTILKPVPNVQTLPTPPSVTVTQEQESRDENEFEVVESVDESSESLLEKQKTLLENLKSINEKIFLKQKAVVDHFFQTPNFIVPNSIHTKLAKTATVEQTQAINTETTMPTPISKQTPKFIRVNSMQTSPTTQTLVTGNQPIIPTTTAQVETNAKQIDDSPIQNSLQNLAILKPTQNTEAVNQIRKLNTEGQNSLANIPEKVPQQFPSVVPQPIAPQPVPQQFPSVAPQPIAPQPVPQQFPSVAPQPIAPQPIAPQPVPQQFPSVAPQPIAPQPVPQQFPSVAPQPVPQQFASLVPQPITPPPISQQFPSVVPQPGQNQIQHQTTLDSHMRNQEQIALQMQAVNHHFANDLTHRNTHEVVNVNSCKVRVIIML